MTSEIDIPRKNGEYFDEPVIAPCPDCSEPTETTKIWRFYTEDWEPTDEIVSITKCPSCYVVWKRKLDEHYAEVARREAEAEARRQEIFARAREAQPSERQIGFDFSLD